MPNEGKKEGERKVKLEARVERERLLAGWRVSKTMSEGQ